jgi:TetR/AcrR family transcriptional repressor of mexJK operon
MTRRQTNPLESTKRTQILKVAQRLFVKQGYGEVSMDALAEAVPVSKRTLYNHFKDKKALFVAVMQNRCGFISSSIEHILLKEPGDLEETLTEMGRQFLSVVLQPEAINIYRTAITQVAHFPDIGKLFYASGPMRCKELFADYLKGQHQRGTLHVSDPTRAANLFFSMLVGRMHMRLLLGVDKRIPQTEISEHIHYVVGVFLRGQMPGKQ